jgi:hypothetical protein
MSRAVHFDDFIIVSDVDMATLLTNHVYYNLTKKKLIMSLSWELVVAYQASLTDDQLLMIIDKIRLELDSYDRLGTHLGSEDIHGNWVFGLAVLQKTLTERHERSREFTVPEVPTGDAVPRDGES